jgi:hypothetical protein
MPRRIEKEITLKTILKFYDTSHFLIIIENCKFPITTYFTDVDVQWILPAHKVMYKK